jgi:ABC-type nitrate/sulfonate/bicarbonate transport system substrate-binding protein
MGDVSRREFLRRTGLGAGGVASVGGLSAFLAACGGDSSSSGSGSGAKTSTSKLITPKIGMSSSVMPTYVSVMAGPILAGSKYGLKITKDAYTSFDSSTTVTQSGLSGQIDVIGQSTLAQLLLIDKGLPFKIFGAYCISDDFVLAGRGDIKTIQQLKDPKTVVATDSPGGAGQAVFDGMLKASNAGFLVTDLPKTIVLESSGERTSALASGDCDATVLHLPQANKVQKQRGDVHIIATLYGGKTNFMKESFSARTDWLEKNVATAAALTASVIQDSRDMLKDYTAFESAVKQFMDEPPPASDLKELFTIMNANVIAPTDGGVTDERVQFMIDLAKEEGLIKTNLTPDKVLDRRPLERAMQLVGA